MESGPGRVRADGWYHLALAELGRGQEDTPARKARRRMAEVGRSRCDRFRKFLVRYEKLARGCMALNHLAAVIITFRKAPVKVKRNADKLLAASAGVARALSIALRSGAAARPPPDAADARPRACRGSAKSGVVERQDDHVAIGTSRQDHACSVRLKLNETAREFQTRQARHAERFSVSGASSISGRGAQPLLQRSLAMSGGCLIGRTMRNIEPCPCVLVTSIQPLCLATMP